jgi:hypothetical protein
MEPAWRGALDAPRLGPSSSPLAPFPKPGGSRAGACDFGFAFGSAVARELQLLATRGERFRHIIPEQFCGCARNTTCWLKLLE